MSIETMQQCVKQKGIELIYSTGLMDFNMKADNEYQTATTLLMILHPLKFNKMQD